MGFYGQVFYDLTNAFGSIVIQSKYKDNTATTLAATGTGGKMTFAPGNDWIQLKADAEKYICTIEHAEADADRDKVMLEPFKKTNTASSIDINNPTILSAGDIIAIPSIQYDNAGHIVKTIPMHYFSMPMNKTETDIKYLETEVDTLKEESVKQDGRLSVLEGTFEEHTASIESLNERVATTEELIPKVTVLEEASVLIGSRSDMTASDTLTITEAIGDMDTLSKQLECESLVEGITDIAAGINATNSSVSNNALATKLVIKNLCNALSEQGITIDYDSLWEV